MTEGRIPEPTPRLEQAPFPTTGGNTKFNITLLIVTAVYIIFMIIYAPKGQ